ncbi:GIN domain-containing protein [Blastomonas sp. SL216]|uniref:GIN domain-containing protein n=1 Tax=Blastomonas sp. SL216 TaxID=2995169 RepID=UPI0023771F45|nr:DUF2807 domain-containing protein [Blastomonas sp. SL216]
MTRWWIAVAAASVLWPNAVSAAERRYTLANFDKVRIEGDVAVEITSDAAPRAIASGDSRALEALTVEVQGGTLLIRRARTNAPVERRARRTTPDALPLVRVGARSVQALTLRGHGSARLDRLVGAKPSATVDGNGSAEIGAVKAEALAVTVTGSGSLKIAGDADTARTMMLGDGLFDAKGLKLSALDFTSEGPVRARMLVNGPARIVANGDAEISVRGKAACTVRQTGNGRIDCGEGETPR